MLFLYHRILQLRLLLCFALILFLSSPATNAQASSSSERSIAVIIDMSASMINQGNVKGNKAPFEFFERLVKQSNAQNEYFIVLVSTRPRLLLDGGSDVESTLKAISKAKSIRPEGATALYDACILGLKKVMQGRYAQKAILLFSDGEDTLSDKTFTDLAGLLKTSNVPVYAIDLAHPRNYDNERTRRSVKVLDTMASVYCVGHQRMCPSRARSASVNSCTIERTPLMDL
jgi:uncharacterized protein with von Willebrand factor type A (vWA) domain